MSQMIAELAPLRYEREMAAPLAAFLSTAFTVSGEDRCVYLREPSIGNVIPDALVGIWAGDLPRYDKLDGISRHVFSRLALSNTAETEHQIKHDLFISDNAAAFALHKLQQAGAV